MGRIAGWRKSETSPSGRRVPVLSHTTRTSFAKPPDTSRFDFHTGGHWEYPDASPGGRRSPVGGPLSDPHEKRTQLQR